MRILIYLLSFLLIILIILSAFIVISVMTIIALKPLYSQIGPTCGFYALIYAIDKCEKINKKQTVKKVIIENVENGCSQVGEIFQMDTFLEIVRNSFPNIKANVVNIENIESVDILLEDNYLIFPVLTTSKNGKVSKIPHYYLLEYAKGEKYYYRTTIFTWIKQMKKSRMINEHKNLENFGFFCWDGYYNGSKLISDIIYYIIDWKFAKYLATCRRNKQSMLENTCIKIDMYGKALAIRKKKL